ncbi:DUF4231 domain-containing protein [Flavobacterium sp. 102]|uniref:DUF4231 domain-containing protein n=1 Tax=Flavobacterium sp. 102 TaxID=2135623 RepID=UPI000EAC4D4F|nr:DUF4231 domain-containing protein [Flavobacterium sp. 102]RKS03085.1 trypsin-like peptidase [Flavobacterium sp. 102]
MADKTKQMLRKRIELYVDAIKKLSLDPYKKDQLVSNYILNLRLMETLANRNLLFQDISNVIVIVLSALVPVFINYSSANDTVSEDTPNHLIWATILSVALAIFNALRQSYKFREKWQNYRRTAELLLIEGQNYFALSGVYQKYVTHDEAFPYFITAISNIRINQINDYIKNALTENETSLTQQAREHLAKMEDDKKKRQEEISKIKAINKEVKDFVKAVPAISYDEIDHQRKLITLYLNDPSYQAPEKIKFKNTDLVGFSYKVEVQTCNSEIQGAFGPSSGVKNGAMTTKDYGSAGCFCLQQGKVVFVTCYHAVKHKSHDWDLFVSNGNDDVITVGGDIVGTILEASKNEELDIAIVEVSDAISYETKLPGQITIQHSNIYLDEENYTDYKEVYIISRTRGYKRIKGHLSAVGKPVTLNYGSKTKKDFKDLDNIIFVHSVSTEPFSKTGDSGSLVFTSSGEPIGIIVGGDGVRCSFVIPYSSVADFFNLSIL